MTSASKSVVSLDGLLERIMGIVKEAPVLGLETAGQGSKDLGFIREHIKMLLLDTFDHEEAGASHLDVAPEEPVPDGEGSDSHREAVDDWAKLRMLDEDGQQERPRMTDEELQARYGIARKDTTCFACLQQDVCQFAWDPYNTDGDCLAEK